MKNIKKIILVMMLTVITLSLTGCEYYKTLTRGGEGEIVIEGKKIISGTILGLEPGTILNFRSKEVGTVGGTVVEGGELVFRNGAKLIAKGTKESPILFEGSGSFTFESTSDGNSVIDLKNGYKHCFLNTARRLYDKVYLQIESK